jgi:hypothetical protein
MSFKPNVNQQAAFYNPVYGLTEREKRFLKKSWAEEFANTVLPAINEERFAVLYSENSATRPNTPVNIVIGALLIKELMGLTDEELFEHIMFSAQYQYALQTESCDEQPFSDRTLSRFRERLYKYETETGRDLIMEEMMSLSGVIGNSLSVTSKLQRVDSTMVSAACRRLARISIMHLTVREMAEMIRGAGKAEEYGDMLGKYYKNQESDDISYRLKGESVRAKMEEILEDAMIILDRAKESFGGTDEYRKLLRMVDDQSKIGSGGARELKEGKEILPTSMQTPYDEDATYRKKSGKQYVGYALNIIESCGEKANIINGYDLQPNIYSDEKFAEDVLNEKQENGETETIITDGAYCSTKILDKAEEKGIDLSATGMAGGIKDGFETGFDIDDETGEIRRCPAGHTPESSKYINGKHVGYFMDSLCESCPYCERCPGIFQKDRAKIEVTDAAIKKAEFANRQECDDDFAKNARKRNGVEGIFSVLKRRYLINHIPARGLLRKKMWIGLKIGAMNIVNLINAQKIANAMC